ncbi:MAG TPA: MazG family protein [Acidimicrobiales bacterium]|nr:MazG family protein [Acidimicrobiales bacterium]
MSPTIVVVGLGPGDPGLVTEATRAAIERVPVRFLRTARHPSASIVEPATALDHLYDGADRQADVYPAIVDALVAAAVEHGEVLYAVPGSPLVAERSVILLLADTRVTCDVLPALSFLDLAWVRLGIDPLAEGVRVVDGHEFAVQAAGERGPLLVSHCHAPDVLSDIKLAVEGDPPASVTVLQRLGLPDESIVEVAWNDLDRSFTPDHLTSIYVPKLAAPVGAELVRFAELVRTLREQCPWDREQTHQSLRRYALEETYEVLEAIDALDEDEPTTIEHFEEELGDLLFQVYFHATIAEQEGWFTLADVARGIHDKLHSRHPHVFADVQADTADAVVRSWEQIKREEKGRTSAFDGIPTTLPGLLYADEVLRKAKGLGVDPPRSDDLGDRLLALVVEARAAGVDPELALRATVNRFRAAAEDVERTAS